MKHGLIHSALWILIQMMTSVVFTEVTKNGGFFLLVEQLIITKLASCEFHFFLLILFSFSLPFGGCFFY